MARDGEEEGDGVEDVAQDELEREGVDAEALADPGEQAVDRRDEGDDGEHVRAVEERRGQYMRTMDDVGGENTHRI